MRVPLATSAPDPLIPEGREEIGIRLLDLYERLYALYGPQHWWPAEEPFEVIVGAILTQSAAWSNVERAISRLKAAGCLTPLALYEVPEERLAELVRPSGYFRAKTAKLKAFAAHLAGRHGGDLERLFAPETAALRQELLALYGIGPETADSILLYAAGRPVFVVDAYTARLLERLGLARAGERYDELQRLFREHLPADPVLFNEYHALIVRHGKEACRKRPLCDGCGLRRACPAGLARERALAVDAAFV